MTEASVSSGRIVAAKPEASPIRLGLVLDQIIFETAGGHSTDEVFIRFLEQTAAGCFDRIEFCSRVRSTESDAPYPLDPRAFEVLPLPWYPNIAALCAKAAILLPRIARALEPALARWDMVIACGVHPVTALVLRMARRRGIPAQLWIRGNMMADLRFRLRGLKRLAGLAAARLTIAAVPSGTPVVSIGRDDYPFLRRMGPVHVGFDSKFGDEDLAPRPRAPRGEGGAGRLLYVGRIAPEKGLEVMAEALRRLRANRPGASPTLTLVGADFFGSSYGEEFAGRLATSELAGSVTFLGHVPYGPRLFELYDTHDLLVLPSLTEGFPQVLLEAMARSLPVVATEVGGVPRLVRNGETGLLVPPDDPAALSAAIERVLDTPELSARLSAGGLECARGYTRQVQVASITRFMAKCFPHAPFAARILSLQ